MKELDSRLEPSQVVAPMPMILDMAILRTIHQRYGIQPEIGLLKFLYPAFCNLQDAAVMSLGNSHHVYHEFHPEPTHRFRGAVEISLQYPPTFAAFANLAGDMLESPGNQFYQECKNRLSTTTQLHQQVPPPSPEEFNLNNLISLHDPADNILEIKPIEHTGKAFEVVDNNFLDRLSKSIMKFKFSGKSKELSSYSALIQHLAISLPTGFMKCSDFHLPALTLSSIVKTYFTAFSQRFSKSIVKAALKNLVQKLVAEKLAPGRTARHRQKTQDSILRSSNLKMAKLLESESGNSTRNLKQEKKHLVKLRKLVSTLSLSQKPVSEWISRSIRTSEARIAQLGAPNMNLDEDHGNVSSESNEDVDVGNGSSESDEDEDHGNVSPDLALDEDLGNVNQMTPDFDLDDDESDDEDEDDEDVGVLEGDQTMVEGDITKSFQTLIVSLIVGWIESVQIPMDSQLNRAIVNQAIPSQADETYDFILNVVNTLRLYYPRYETLKTEKEVIKSQLIPFLTLCNWSFQKMKYPKMIKRFIPQISAGKLWALSLNPDSLYDMFLHKKAGMFQVKGVTSKKLASPIIFNMLFKSSVIQKAVDRLNMKDQGQLEKAVFADRFEMARLTLESYFAIQRG